MVHFLFINMSRCLQQNMLTVWKCAYGYRPRLLCAAFKEAYQQGRMYINTRESILKCVCMHNGLLHAIFSSRSGVCRTQSCVFYYTEEGRTFQRVKKILIPFTDTLISRPVILASTYAHCYQSPLKYGETQQPSVVRFDNNSKKQAKILT